MFDANFMIYDYSTIRPVDCVMKESSLRVNVLLHQTDVYSQAVRCKSSTYDRIFGIIRQIDVL